jgi:hypothetical protein
MSTLEAKDDGRRFRAAEVLEKIHERLDRDVWYSLKRFHIETGQRFVEEGSASSLEFWTWMTLKVIADDLKKPEEYFNVLGGELRE